MLDTPTRSDSICRADVSIKARCMFSKDRERSPISSPESVSRPSGDDGGPRVRGP